MHRIDVFRSAAVAAICVLFIYIGYDVRQFVQAHEYVQARFRRLSWSVAACVAISISRIVWVVCFRPLGNLLMPRKKWTTEERLEKIEKFCNVTFKFVYMVLASIAGFSVLRNKPWMPPILRVFGFNDNVPVASVWDGYPRDYEELSDDIHLYYMVELGYALHSLLFHVVWTKHRNDFWEMMIHHFAAIALLAFSYLGDKVRIGTLVLIVHDVPDIFVYFTKVVVDISGVAAAAGLTMMLVSWGYMRLYVYPLYIIAVSQDALSLVNQPGLFPLLLYMIGMLFVLQLLHVYWYGLFLGMGYHYVVTGTATDMQARTDELGSTDEIVSTLKQGSQAKAANGKGTKKTR